MNFGDVCPKSRWACDGVVELGVAPGFAVAKNTNVIVEASAVDICLRLVFFDPLKVMQYYSLVDAKLIHRVYSKGFGS
jgi:hypothetical protein